MYYTCMLLLCTSLAGQTNFSPPSGKSKSGHPLIPFRYKCAGMLAHCSFTKGKFSEYQLTRKETLPTFRLDAPVFFRAKVKLDANTCYLLAAHIKNPSKHVTGCPGRSGVVLNQPRPAISSGSPSSSRGAPALRHG